PNDLSYIPSLYVSAEFGAAASDNQYAVPEGALTDAPDVAIGRLPVLDTATLKTVIAKTVAFATALPPANPVDFQASDWGDSAQTDPSFQASVAAAHALLPAAYS